MKLVLLEKETVLRDGNGSCVISHINRNGTWYITNKRLCFNAIPVWKMFLLGWLSYVMEGAEPLIAIRLEDIISVKKKKSCFGSFYQYKIKTTTREFTASFNTDAPMWIRELMREIALYTNNTVVGDVQSFDVEQKQF